uniref:Calpain catalytic domain-containing protein n=1 Tax=Acrobeloides nanus TaxID=290746 RepID=A0A914E1H8_9BILA
MKHQVDDKNNQSSSDESDLSSNISPITQSLDNIKINSKEHEVVQHRLYQTAKTVRNQIAKTFHEHHEKLLSSTQPNDSKEFEKINASHLLDQGFKLNDDGLFEDLNFTPEKALSVENIVWQRPQQLVKNPKFIADGQNRTDIKQGGIGDCWFLAAIANLTMCEKLFFKVVPMDQSFSKEHGYVGIFRFNFWQYGTWKEVIVDDLLPTIEGRRYGVSSGDPDEMWSSLLEKAYAKLHGSYEALDGGATRNALVDLTGENLPALIKRGLEIGCFFGCAIVENSSIEYGLQFGHAYSVTGFIEKTIDGKCLRLIRARNPWDIFANFRLECEMDNLQKSTWTSCIFEGHMSTRKDPPLYQFTLTKPEFIKDGILVVSLLQKYRRRTHKKDLAIEFSVMSYPNDEEKKIGDSYFAPIREISMNFIVDDQTCDNETYAVQPRIHQKPKKGKKRNAQAEQETKFTIRIYTNMTIESEQGTIRLCEKSFYPDAPDVQPEVIPDAQPEVIPDAQPEVIPDVQPEVIPDAQPKVLNGTAKPSD